MALKKISFPALKVPDDMAYILGLFVITRIALTAVGHFAHVVLWKQSFSGLEAFTKIWTVWDGWWYIGIARDGYSALPVNSVDMANYAFFPLYPALVRLASLAVGDYALSGIIVSNICLLVACYYIYRYVGLDSDQATAKRSVKYLILFPAAFVFSAVLTESLFVALVIACLYYARKGNWLAAGVLGFFVPLARLPGLAIVVPLSYEYVRQNAPSLAALKDHVLQRLAKPDVLALLMPTARPGAILGRQLLPDRRLPRVPPHTVDLGRPHGPAARRAADPSRPGQWRHFHRSDLHRGSAGADAAVHP